ncbi:zinc finger MYND domain-containing protein 11 [Drosophila kikkawai]|uniref:Zinc finger MYND domain-containing protein 11 n=1 Tax=Drosophila kikkawai TaxID=30033 RepID=A0A6P4IXX7_DROKI|nr:uncharacterized protein LOC108078454 [Drosophila kikkawai]
MANDFPPCAIRLWMHKLQKGAAQAVGRLENCLLPSMSKETARLSVKIATERGILVTNKDAKVRRPTLKFCQKLSSLPKYSSDPYCYECHLPGDLRKCVSCERCFHEECQRKDPEKPTYLVPSDKDQPYQFPLSVPDQDQNESVEVVAMSPTPQPLLDHNSNIEQESPAPQTPHFVKHESYEWDDDVFYVSEKKGVRQRSQATVKNEEALGSDTDASSELELCTRCRLLKLATIRNPPQLDKKELACLLSKVWGDSHSWMSTDVATYMADNWKNRDIALVKRILFKSDILGLEDIKRNIEAEKYTYLMEFHADLLDLQHNMAVFFGHQAEEYEPTKRLIRDVSHYIQEIRKCVDCFRYSNEENLSKMWFAKPCTQRHELVLAKTAGYPHWPAKVISVYSGNPNKYDVRFFGGDHSRALLAERDIIPIDMDTDLHFKAKNTHGFNDALLELHCHMMLSGYSATLFGFYADPAEAEELIKLALSRCTKSGVSHTPGKRGRPATPAAAKKRKLLNSSSCPSPVPTRVMPRRSVLLRESGGTVNQPENGIYQNLTEQILKAHDDLQRYQSELTAMQQELNVAKLKRWCHHCLQEAAFDCCFAASYCSADCQRRDKRRHQGACKVNQ